MPTTRKPRVTLTLKFDSQILKVWHDVMMESVGDRPCYRFVAPVRIEVYGEKPSLADLREWLQKAVRIVVDSPQHGLGPGDAVGVVIADFAETKLLQSAKRP